MTDETRTSNERLSFIQPRHRSADGGRCARACEQCDLLAEIERLRADAARCHLHPEDRPVCFKCEDLHRASWGDVDAQPPSGSQLAWLVERQEDGRAVWVTANHQWTTDASEAVWFVRKLDAELFCWNLSGEATAVEHMFCNGPASTKETTHE